MAERIVRKLIDDIDGSEIQDGDGERVEFSLRGGHYQIDLSKANVAKLEKVIKPYVEAAAKIRGSKGPRAKAKGNGKAAPQELAAIREWARKNGREVANRGRIKAEIVEAFEAAR